MMGVHSQGPDPSQALWVWYLFDLPIEYCAADPLPIAGLAFRQDHKHRLSLQTDASLSLIIKRAIQATGIQVDPDH
jgi:hypothetical protein